jgi:predicted RNA-binding Zn-ribbon protein involved in translation (DUF1610 family)
VITNPLQNELKAIKNTSYDALMALVKANDPNGDYDDNMSLNELKAVWVNQCFRDDKGDILLAAYLKDEECPICGGWNIEDRKYNDGRANGREVRCNTCGLEIYCE